MCDKGIKRVCAFVLMIVMLLTFMLLDRDVEASTSAWEWSNSRSPLGTVGATYYLKDRVKVSYAVGNVIEEHYIQGTAKLVKNLVDPYCYVKISGIWYVHLAGIRTDNGHSTTGWYRESDVISSAGLDEVNGYIVYKSSGVADTGTKVDGDILVSNYSSNSSGWITHSSKSMKYHSVTSGEKLGSSGLYNPTTFGLSKKGYEVIAWQNVDSSGKIYGTYDYTTNYSVDNFVTASGAKLKNSTEGAYIYLVPVWLYTNEAPVITAGDVHIYAASDWDEGRLLEDVSVWDKEDGDLTGDLIIINKQELKQELSNFAAEEVEDVRQMELIVEVEDSLDEVSRLVITVIVYGIEGIKNDYGYVRYISSDYTDTFSTTSVWTESSKKSFLMNALIGS